MKSFRIRDISLVWKFRLPLVITIILFIISTIIVSSLLGKTSGHIEDLGREVPTEYLTTVDQAKDQINQTMVVLITAIIISAVIGGILAFILNNTIRKSLGELLELGHKIGQGDLNVAAVKYDGKDEIGQLAEAMNYMSRNLREMVANITQVSYQVSSQSEELTKMSHDVKQGSEQIAVTMQELSSGSEVQARSASDIAEMTDMLNQQVAQSNDDGEALYQSSVQVLEQSNKGIAQMDRTTEQMQSIRQIVSDAYTKMQQLENSTENISKLVQVIQDISEQTNLLALNASIEAARAGEHGRGFAVVADEVKNLSEQVGTSVNEVTGIITSIQEDAKMMATSLEAGYKEVEEGTQSMIQTKASFDQITQAVHAMTERINNVAEGLHAIQKNGERIAYTSQEIASVSQEASAGIEETAASAEEQNSSMEEISETVKRLSEMAEEFKEIIGRFKL